jgi:hypothetical protein
MRVDDRFGSLTDVVALNAMSAFIPKADIQQTSWDVR